MRNFDADYVAEAHEANKDGSLSCGVFLPIPYNLAKDFPDKSEHDDSVPHLTVLYVGDCSPEAYKTLCKIVRQVAVHIKPFSLDLTNYGEFMNKEGLKIAHMKPGLTGSMKLAVLHDVIRRAIEQFGKEIDVAHSYGDKPKKGVPYAAQFKAHATLAYLPAMLPYRGPKPTGSWQVTEIECWGHEKIRIPLGRTTAQEPLGLTRDPLAIDYPMAIPEVSRGEHPKPDAQKLRVSGSRITIEAHQDMISGGKADRSKLSDFDPEQLAMGIKIEREHTKDPALAREIATDHLRENPRYYSALKKMEKQFEDVIGGSMGARGAGTGGSSGGIPLDGTLPYHSQQKKIDKILRRKKLAGL